MKLTCLRCGKHPRARIYSGAASPCDESQRDWCWRCRAVVKRQANRLVALAAAAPRDGASTCANPTCMVRLRSNSPRALCHACIELGYTAPPTDGTWLQWAARRPAL